MPNSAPEELLASLKLCVNGSGLVLVACSGGADSVALLHAAKTLAPERVECVHFDHRWSSTSTDCALFVRELALSWNIPYHGGQAESSGRFSEDAARSSRYSYFERIAAQTGAQCLLLGHHREDQLETIFFRLLRGTGSEGLGAMRESRLLSPEGNTKTLLVRPWLSFSRELIREYTTEHFLTWREDPSNQDLSLKRNLLRLAILPEIEKAFPDFGKRLLNTSELIVAEGDFIQEQANTMLSADSVYKKSDFLAKPIALQRRLLKSELEKLKISVSFSLIEELRELVFASMKAKRQLGAKKFFVLNELDFSFLETTSSTKKQDFKSSKIPLQTGKYKLSGYGILEIEKLKTPVSEAPQGDNYEVLLALRDEQIIVFSPREAKMRFQPLNNHQSVLLKDFLIQRKAKQKLSKPVLLCFSDDQIIWIPGLEIADSVKVTSQNPATYRLKLNLNPN